MSAFYTGLYLTGINRVAFHNGSGFCYLDLSSVVTVKKTGAEGQYAAGDERFPAVDGCIFFTGTETVESEYADPERTARLREMEQELIANLKRSVLYWRLISPM